MFNQIIITENHTFRVSMRGWLYCVWMYSQKIAHPIFPTGFILSHSSLSVSLLKFHYDDDDPHHPLSGY